MLNTLSKCNNDDVSIAPLWVIGIPQWYPSSHIILVLCWPARFSGPLHKIVPISCCVFCNLITKLQ